MIIGRCTDAISLFLLENKDPILPLAHHSPKREKIDPKLIRQFCDDMAKGDYSKIEIAYYDQRQEEYEKIWEQLKKDNLAYFYKHSYLPVRFLSEADMFEVVIPSVGRPKAKKPIDVIKSIRISSKLDEQLGNYCKTNNISASETIRQALEQMLKRNKNSVLSLFL